MRLLNSCILTILMVLVGCGMAAAAEPQEIVSQFYANFDNLEDPPGGMAAWSPGMQELWRRDAEYEERLASGEIEFEGIGLTFDFVSGSQETYFTSYKIKTLTQTDDEAEVLAALERGADWPYRLHYGFIRSPGGAWQINEVWTVDGEPGTGRAWTLSEILNEIP